jgi:hypothetical protein
MRNAKEHHVAWDQIAYPTDITMHFRRSAAFNVLVWQSILHALFNILWPIMGKRAATFGR